MHRVPTVQWDHFNNRITTRKYIECVFGIVFAKWLILSKYTETCTENVFTKCLICSQLDTNRGDNIDFDHCSTMQRLKDAEATNAKDQEVKAHQTTEGILCCGIRKDNVCYHSSTQLSATV